MQTPPTGFDVLRTLAVSRIYLDNFEHITAYWVGLGLKLAQVALKLGADDLHGTNVIPRFAAAGRFGSFHHVNHEQARDFQL